MDEPPIDYRLPSERFHAPIPGYLLAISVVAVATLVRFICWPFFGTHAPLLLYYIAIFLAARYGGLRSGLVATLLGGAVGTSFFMEPGNIFLAPFNQQVRVLIFFGEGILISWLCESLHIARRRAEANLQQAQSVQEQLKTEIDERRQTQESLTAAHRLMQAITDNATTSIFMMDPGGHCTFLNPAAEAMTGYRLAEIAGKPLHQVVRPMHPDGLAILTQSSRGPQDVGVSTNLRGHEDVFLRKDGTSLPVMCNARPIFKDGSVAGIVLEARDITDEKRATESLKEADRRKDEFLAILAHELRNPLAPLGNALQLLETDDEDQEVVRQARDVMKRQFGHLVRLIDDLLDVSRITHGRLELRRERVELSAALESAIETSRPLMERFGHRFHVPARSQPIYLDADLARLSQVFSNLLNNAAKYTQPGGQIWITVERADDQVVVAVRDNGIGIPIEMQSTIFELFAQANRSLSRSRGGLGIGLTLVKRLVELHDGTIEAHSEGEGQGSEFRVSLPATADVVAERTRWVTAANGLPKTTCAGRRILAADDNEDSADTLSLLLKRLGGQVRTAYDGRAALEAAAEFRPDVAFLDIGMPHLDGYEVASRIREQPWGKQIVLIALTGWGQSDDRCRSRAAGFDHHLVKPVEQESLKSLFAEMQAGAAAGD